MPGTLYIVATPIGNLGDITLRALDTLRQVDFIAAEDTRVTLRLLNHFEIRKPLVSYYEQNSVESGEKILSRLLAGESCALVSDAGTPAISDPGRALVTLCAENGVEAFSLPGACAAISAVALSGLDVARFCFEGFLFTAKRTRRERLGELSQERRAIVIYEAPHKLRATLDDLCECFGEERRCAVCRELTKLHEQTLRTTLGQARKYFAENEPRGEFVLVISGSDGGGDKPTLEQALALARSYREVGLSASEAARRAAGDTGLPRGAIYRELVRE